MRPNPWCSSLAAVLCLALVAPAMAQTVDGRVADELTGVPLPGAVVILLDTAGHQFMRIETDDRGQFLLVVPAQGRYRLWSDRLGYAPVLSPEIEVGPDPVPVTILLPPLPVTLEEIRVTAAARRLALEETGYYERRELGVGRFIDLEQIEARAPVETTDLVRTEPMVRLVPDFGGDGGTGTAMVFRGAVRGLQPGGGRLCGPTLVLDGVKVRDSGPLASDSATGRRPIRLNELVHPSEILAVEPYPSGAGAPPQWMGLDAGCSVVVIWTKRRRP